MTKGKAEKIQKNVELVSLLSSYISSMNVGDKVKMTPLAKSIILSNKNSPHVHTVRGKLDEAEIWQEVTENIKFSRKKNKLEEVEKIEPDKSEIFLKKEIRNGIANLSNRIDLIEHNQNKIIETLNLFSENLKKHLEQIPK
ncbi:MAG: hypothetical protein KKF56_05005 [Nanoarchaeota archaeon]|nr:hypothetical protein [Nanoarchaeota archaeon]